MRKVKAFQPYPELPDHVRWAEGTQLTIDPNAKLKDQDGRVIGHLVGVENVEDGWEMEFEIEEAGK